MRRVKPMFNHVSRDLSAHVLSDMDGGPIVNTAPDADVLLLLDHLRNAVEVTRPFRIGDIGCCQGNCRDRRRGVRAFPLVALHGRWRSSRPNGPRQASRDTAPAETASRECSRTYA